MKLNTKNFSGNMNFPYRIIWNTPDDSEVGVVVWLVATNPITKEDIHIDCAVSTFEKTYKENVRFALLRAEEKWGLNLLTVDLTAI